MDKSGTPRSAGSPVASLLQSDDTERPEKSVCKDESCGCRCGPNLIAPCTCLQPFATAKWALAFACFGNFFQQFVLNGVVGVTISTLEKRFELRSTESATVASMADLGRGLAMCLIMILSSRADKPRAIGWGLMIAGTAAFMIAVPHFTAPEYTYGLDYIFNFCKNVTDPDCSVSPVRSYQYWFILCFLLYGIGTCPLAVHSVTYLDENVQKKNSALYNAIFMAGGGLGPALGYVFGGMTLELYTYVSEDSVEIDSSSYSWVGAWWIGYLISGACLIIISIPLLMLPKRLPGTEKHRIDRDLETQKSHLESTANDGNSGALTVFRDTMMLLRNKPYIILTIGFTLNSALIYGFNTFGAKYIESVFEMTPFHSSLLFGIAAIFASAGAMIFSGMVIKKLDLQVPGILKFIIICGVLSALCSVGFLVHCDEITFAGGNVPYENDTDVISLTSSCNSDCDCSTDRYEPVCANGITYFSPCFAGCEVQLNETSYSDCKCVSKQANQTVSVSVEMCDQGNCGQIVPFMFIVFICFFTSVVTITPTIQVVLRCVPFNKRDLALSFLNLFSRLLGVIPGRLLAGYVLDKACIVWSTECGEQGACKVYNRWHVARNNTILLVAQTLLCAIAYVFGLITYKPAGDAISESSKQDKSDSSSCNERTVEFTTRRSDDLPTKAGSENSLIRADDDISSHETRA